MASCSGLPICLSGIEIFPQEHRPMVREARSRAQSKSRAQFRPSSASGCTPDGEIVGSEDRSTSLSAMASGDGQRDNGASHEAPHSEIYSNSSEWPRLALAQQMADLDCRREAVRRRSLQNRSYLMDYRLLRQSAVILACLKSQSKEEDVSVCTPNRSACAKAA